jgi:hypothetical protein
MSNIASLETLLNTIVSTYTGAPYHFKHQVLLDAFAV